MLSQAHEYRLARIADRGRALMVFGCLCFVLIAIVGCAAKHSPTTRAIVATRPSEPPEAFLSLDQLPNRPELAKLPAATGPTAMPSLDAIELYARARGALVDGQRFSAVNFLERAVQADPNSFELRYDLGKAYSESGVHGDRAVESFEAAAKIDPDNLNVQAELGRQYLARDDADNALKHLRLAVQTEGYKTDEDVAALTDFYLARALQNKGYDRAALDQYDQLIKRLEKPSLALRGNPEVAFIATHPENLYLSVGQLCEKHHEYDEALAAYQAVAEHDPSSFEAQARVVNVLLEMGRRDQAMQQSRDLIDKFSASNESLELFKNVYHATGHAAGIVAALTQLHASHPGGRAILYALTDALNDQNRREDAAKLLRDAMLKDPRPLDLFRKLFGLYESHDDTTQAAILWIDFVSAHPDALDELSTLWDKLTSISRKNSIHLTDLQKLPVAESSLACQEYLVANQARLWGRYLLARDAMSQATHERPPFAPAFRQEIGEIWTRQDWDQSQKQSASDALIQTVKTNGDEALAEELLGLSMVAKGDANGALKQFAAATQLGDESPDLQLTYARAALASGNTAKFEQLLWKLIAANPEDEQAYQELYGYYSDEIHNDTQANKVLTAWLAAVPSSVNGRITRVGNIILHGQQNARNGVDPIAAGELLLLDVFRDAPDDPEVLKNLKAFYTAIGRPGEFTTRLRDEFHRHPANRAAMEFLVKLDASEKNADAAIAILDAARAASGDDPDLLYYLAHLYDNVDQHETSEQVLARVIHIDPAHAGANNDLGYAWADQGKNLDRAEAMIRIAVDAEPDNESFLDSLGWVLYKRGRFAEARKYFDRAVAPASLPDPTVLDHLGDTIYRLHDVKQARQTWDSAMKRIVALAQINELRDEHLKLRAVLIDKIKQADDGKPVTVAPIADETAAGKKEQATSEGSR